MGEVLHIGGKEFDAAIKRLRELRQPFVTVGVHSKDDDRDGGGATNAEIAAFNEFGTSTIPARPFMRPTIHENQAQIAALLGTAVRDRIKGASLEKALGVVGLAVQAMVRKKITDLGDPPNAPSTIAKKGSSNPLIDTGEMRRSIGYEVHTSAKRIPKEGD